MTKSILFDMAIPKKLLNKIYTLSKKEIKLGLNNMISAIKTLEIDLSGIRFIHVAGTNGKGSTCSILYNLIYHHMGNNQRVGIYTSPHLLRYNERIKVNNKFISDHEITRSSELIFKKCENIPLTFFEFTTLLSFLHFTDKKVNFAVIETGLGGRLDATNVINPEIAVITSISLDHTHYLGDSIEKIALEKAGIFKKNSIVILSETSCPELLSAEAKKAGASQILQIGKDFNFSINKDKSFNINILENINYKNIRNKLLGRHQYNNTACAIAAFSLLNMKCSQRSINNAIEKTTWHGRLEPLDIDKKKLYIDVSHNPEGIKATIDFLIDNHRGEDFYIACGFMKDKDYITMIKILQGVAKKLFLVPTHINNREISKRDYEKIIQPRWENTFICGSFKAAIQELKKEKGVLLFTGSIYNFENISKLLKDYYRCSG